MRTFYLLVCSRSWLSCKRICKWFSIKCTLLLLICRWCYGEDSEGSRGVWERAPVYAGKSFWDQIWSWFLSYIKTVPDDTESWNPQGLAYSASSVQFLSISLHQEEQIEPAAGGNNTFHSDSSWKIPPSSHSLMRASQGLSEIKQGDESYLRLSLGQFFSQRSEALGCLGSANGDDVKRVSRCSLSRLIIYCDSMYIWSRDGFRF